MKSGSIQAVVLSVFFFVANVALRAQATAAQKPLTYGGQETLTVACLGGNSNYQSPVFQPQPYGFGGLAGHVQCGQNVDVVRTKGDYYLIRFGEVEGYMHSSQFTDASRSDGASAGARTKATPFESKIDCASFESYRTLWAVPELRLGGKLQCNERVTVLGVSGKYAHVRAGKTEGYVARNALPEFGQEWSVISGSVFGSPAGQTPHRFAPSDGIFTKAAMKDHHKYFTTPQARDECAAYISEAYSASLEAVRQAKAANSLDPVFGWFHEWFRDRVVKYCREIPHFPYPREASKLQEDARAIKRYQRQAAAKNILAGMAEAGQRAAQRRDEEAAQHRTCLETVPVVSEDGRSDGVGVVSVPCPTCQVDGGPCPQ